MTDLQHILNNPLLQLGVNLLEQGGPQPGFSNFGQSVGRAFSATQGQLQSQEQADLRRQLVEAQIAELQRPRDVKPPGITADVGGFKRFTTGPQAGQRVFPAAQAPAGEQFRTPTTEEISNLGFTANNPPPPGVQINTRTGRANIPGRGVNVRVGDGDKGAAATAATAALTNIIERGDASNNALNNADLLEISLSQVEGGLFDTGIFSGLRQDLGRLAALTGRGDNFVESIAASENIDAISNKLKIVETQALKGSISNREFEAAGKINTDLGNTNLGNSFAVKRMRAIASMDKWRAERFEQLDNNNPDASDKELSRLLKIEFRNIPYVSKTLKDNRGLNIFFTQFRDEVLKEQPNISTQELIEQWKALHR